MLFNTKWEVKADPLSLDSLIAWLKNQPPEKTYCYMDTGDCLIHQYFTFAGVDVESVGSTVYSLNSDPYEDLAMPQGFDRVAQVMPHTFGAALKRARSLLR